MPGANKQQLHLPIPSTIPPPGNVSNSLQRSASIQEPIRTPRIDRTQKMTQINGNANPTSSTLKTSSSASNLASLTNGNFSDLTSEAVKAYLNINPGFLESYVLSTSISRDQFQRWATKRSHKDAIRAKKAASKGTGPSSNGNPARIGSAMNSSRGSRDWQLVAHTTKRKTLLDLSTEVDTGGNKNQILYELMASCVKIANADGGHLYLYDKDSQELYYYDSDLSGEPQPSRRFRPGSCQTISAHVAKTLEPIRTIDIDKDERFGDGIGLRGLSCQAVLCYPIVDSSGVFLGVMELYRYRGNTPFSDKDEENVSITALWGAHSVYFCQLFHTMNRQRKLNDFLLSTAKSIFQDIVSMDTVIMKVMNFAQKLVNADRASLFLVDGKGNELYARIFDVGTGSDEASTLDSSGHKEIRFPMDRGIAGHVATTGHVLNIEDAYTDTRFNREVDLKTGYTTKTILCMPIYIRGVIIGVVQMVNKINGVFTKQDEEAFETFAIYCGLALHHAKLYDKIRRSEQKYKVALEVLAYHSLCSREEILKIKRHPLPERIPELESFDVHPYNLTEIEKPLYAVYMFVDLFSSQKSFEYDDLVRFILTVRKNYRRVPYHNWTHGWSVAHAMYVILKQSGETFTTLERLSMFISAICHDLDHRGKNNAYMKNFGTPLAAIYSTSVMEHHHFNQCVTILQQEGHNIFRSLSAEEYKWVLGNIKNCILATDLALFFPNKAKLKKLVDDNLFTWKSKEHRLLVQAICMTGCDLIASAKPWDVQTDTVRVIFEEFYEQGDAERQSGKEPIPMMDRNKAFELPQMQVGFMNGICIPCYDILSIVLPAARPLGEKAKFNLTKWQELADEQKRLQEEKALLSARPENSSNP